MLYHNIRGLYNNIKDLQIICQKYDVILCSETLVFDLQQVSEISLPEFNKPTLLIRNPRLRICGLATYIVFCCYRGGKCLYLS